MILADPPRKRIDTHQFNERSAINYELLSEGSPVVARRNLFGYVSFSIHSFFVNFKLTMVFVQFRNGRLSSTSGSRVYLNCTPTHRSRRTNQRNNSFSSVVSLNLTGRDASAGNGSGSGGGMFSIPNTPNLSVRSAGSNRSSHDHDKSIGQLNNNNSDHLDKFNNKLNQAILDKNFGNKLQHLRDSEAVGGHSPRLDHRNLSLDCSTPPDSPNMSSQHYWKCRLTNLKNNFLGTPRFHRKKMTGMCFCLISFIFFS